MTFPAYQNSASDRSIRNIIATVTLQFPIGLSMTFTAAHLPHILQTLTPHSAAGRQANLMLIFTEAKELGLAQSPGWESVSELMLELKLS